MGDYGRRSPDPGSGPNGGDEWRDVLGVPLSRDLTDIPVPTHWPRVPAADIEAEWNGLRAWVEWLCTRFAHLDHHIIPRCWWRHNEHVEALAALRDHERSSFCDSAPASAPLDWFRALRDIAALLRAWTAETGCGATHQPPPATLRVHSDDWDRFVADDKAARQSAEIDRAVHG
jgi:hypothetical protein